MTKDNKIWIGVAVAGLALLYLLAKSGNNSAQQTTVASLPAGDVATQNTVPPTYLTYNLPKLPDINVTYPSSNNPNGTGSNTGASCGCQGANPAFFSSLQAMLQNYENKVSGFVQTYWDNIGSAFPDAVSQYFNAVAGTKLYNSSSQFLGG